MISFLLDASLNKAADDAGDTGPVEKLLSALRESVRRRTVNNIFKVLTSIFAYTSIFILHLS